MRPAIVREIQAAHKRGEHWTPFRKFRGKYERWGAARCCRMLRYRNCPKPSVWVSYAVGDIQGRIALCDFHRAGQRLP